MGAAKGKNVAAPTITEEISPPFRFTLTQTVGERIRWARERKELTQKELGERVGKCRATLVQYEQGRIAAPVNVIADIAQVLGTSPEFLAFGRTGLPGITNAEEDVLVLEEITKGRDGQYVSGGWGMPKTVFTGYRGETKGIKVVTATLEEPAFNIVPGDRYFVDTSIKIDRDGYYVIDTNYGSRMVRIKTGFTDDIKIVSGVDGTEEVLDPKALTVVGLVVGVFRHTV